MGQTWGDPLTDLTFLEGSSFGSAGDEEANASSSTGGNVSTLVSEANLGILYVGVFTTEATAGDISVLDGDGEAGVTDSVDGIVVT